MVCYLYTYESCWYVIYIHIYHEWFVIHCEKGFLFQILKHCFIRKSQCAQSVHL